MKLYIISVLFLLIPLFGFCQGGFPRILIIDGDTICGITLQQVTNANVTYQRLQECSEVRDTLRSQRDSALVLIDTLKVLAAQLQFHSVIQDSLIKEKELQVKMYQDLYTKGEKKIKWLKTQRGIIWVLLTGAAILYAVK